MRIPLRLRLGSRVIVRKPGSIFFNQEGVVHSISGRYVAVGGLPSLQSGQTRLFLPKELKSI